MISNHINYQEKRKRILTISLIGIIIVVLSLSIAYATLSESLTIQGSTTITASTWDIRLSYVGASKFGSATYTTPTITDLTIGNYTVSLTKPGDYVIFRFNFNNYGTLNAEIASVVNSIPTCTSSTGNTTDEKLVCDNLNISLTYSDSTIIQSGDVINQHNEICYSGNQSTNNATMNIELKIGLDSSMTSVPIPSSAVTISNLNNSIYFTQTDKKCYLSTICFVAGTKVLTEDGYKNIEDIKVDDYVYSMNTDTNNYELQRVNKKYESLTYETFEITVNNQIIEATGKHPFYIVDKGWIRAADIKVGDKLSTLEDIDTTVTKIERKVYKEPITVYNMEIDELHNYLVTESDYLVHNAQSPDL